MFKLIGDFPDYAIYDDGRVWSNKSKKFLLPYKMPTGYLRVTLRKEGRPHYKYVHRLVADAFVDNPNNYEEVNHKDENKSNNDFTNLEWCTHKMNNNYGTKNNRANDTKQNSTKWKKHLDNLHNQGKKKVLCKETGQVFDSITEAAAFAGCTLQNISIVLRGKGNTAKGYHFSYYEEVDYGE